MTSQRSKAPLNKLTRKQCIYMYMSRKKMIAWLGTVQWNFENQAKPKCISQTSDQILHKLKEKSESGLV